jgi:hypothetical protein
MAFVKATKKQAKGRIALIGPSGSGKTWTALEWATALLAICKPGMRIRVVDSERGSASKYSDAFDFDAEEKGMPDFSPKSYREKIAEAVADGNCGVVVIDSLSHAWSGKGGALEMADNATARSKSHNKFAAWREVTPEHNELVDALIQCPAHLIVTMRAKTEYVLEEDERGKKVPRKIGMAPIQRDGLEYEFDLVGDMDNVRNTFTESKTRCRHMKGAVIREPKPADLAPFVGWLSDGAPAPEVPLPTVKPAAQPKAAAAATQIPAQVSGGGTVVTNAEQEATAQALIDRCKLGFKAKQHRDNWIRKPDNASRFQSLPEILQAKVREAFKVAPVGPEYGNKDEAANTDGGDAQQTAAA